ncbi:pyocin knob domain-containing protein [Yersinia enterocolitica]|uniref:pyocin knob domain-containing protein n=1 Tax=Yersinia enterocolitica TaxID=630 RepID=UPI003F441A0B
MPATQEDRLYGLTTSVAVKPAVAISADYNITLFGEQTITSSTFTGERTTTTTAGMRVLVMGQANPADNGIWIASVATWARAPDFDGARDAVNGTLVFSIYGDCWQLEADDPVRIGYSELVFRSTYPFSGEANLFQRSLRVPETSISILPQIDDRKNKILAFDELGNPMAVVPESGSAADVLIQLAKPTGAGLIGDGVGTVATERLSIHGGKMQGPLELVGSAVNDNEAVPLLQLNEVAELKLPLSKTSIIASTNLNILGPSDIGVKYQSVVANATLALNYPITEPGSLLVLPSIYGIQQEYTSATTGRKFVRSLSAAWNGSGPWQPWVEIGGGWSWGGTNVSGWRKDPRGNIEQWGSTTVGTSTPGLVINLPTPFPTAGVTILINANVNPRSVGGEANNTAIFVSNSQINISSGQTQTPSLFLWRAYGY